MIGALGQQDLTARRAIDARQGGKLAVEPLMRQVDIQRAGIGAKQRRRRRQLWRAARGLDVEAI
jgi:hypothetical protein